MEDIHLMLTSTKKIHKEYYDNGWLRDETKYWENGKIRSKKFYGFSQEMALMREHRWDDGGNIRFRSDYRDGLIYETKWNNEGAMCSGKAYQEGMLTKEIKWNKDGTSSIKEYHNGRLEWKTEYDEKYNMTSNINYKGRGKRIP